MKTIIICTGLMFISILAWAQSSEDIELTKPDLTRGLPLMTALSQRASARDFDTTALSIQDISDLLWAANGINRSDEGKRTAPSAMNAQDIDIYVFMKKGVYFYNAQQHLLEFITAGDHRALVAGRQEEFAGASLMCLLVSDIFRFRFGEDSSKLMWAAFDAGIVSQNISVFCASMGLLNRPRGTMEKDKLRELLDLKETQHSMLNNVVSYRKE